MRLLLLLVMSHGMFHVADWTEVWIVCILVMTDALRAVYSSIVDNAEDGEQWCLRQKKSEGALRLDPVIVSLSPTLSKLPHLQHFSFQYTFTFTE